MNRSDYRILVEMAKADLQNSPELQRKLEADKREFQRNMVIVGIVSAIFGVVYFMYAKSQL